MGLDLPDTTDPASLLRVQGIIPGFGDKWLRVDSVGEEPWPPVTSTPEAFTALVREFNRLDWRTATHVPSNESLEHVLNAFEAADRDRPLRGRRWVIEHIYNARPEHLARLATLGVVVSTGIAGYRTNYEAAVKTLGQAEADRQTPVRDMLDAKLVVVTGSDYAGPTPETLTPNNPFIPLYYYVTRKNTEGRVLGPGQKISRQEALRIATNNAAYATWDEQSKGSIEPGKLAAFVVTSGDYLSVPDDQILHLRALATYVGGKAVFAAPGAP